MAQRDWIEKDYYGVLGVGKDASKAEIKRAYRKLAQKFHPDANKGDETAEQRFKEISEAHSVLTNDSKRKEYDEVRRLAESGIGNPFGFGTGSGRVRVNVGDIGDLFGDTGLGDLFGFDPRRGRRGQDLETDVHLTFKDAAEGTMLEIANGTKVRVPPGVKNGSRIRARGKGEAGPRGGEPGDLFVRVHVEPHPFFSLGEDGNLVIRVPVTLTEATLGSTVEVPTLDEPVTVKIPPGTSAGNKLRVKGRGGKRPSGQRADLIVEVDIEIPKKLSRREKELLEELEREQKTNPRAHLEGAIRAGSAKRTARRKKAS
jgi:molecular chaperone DnaJ